MRKGNSCFQLKEKNQRAGPRARSFLRVCTEWKQWASGLVTCHCQGGGWGVGGGRVQAAAPASERRLSPVILLRSKGH